VEAGVDDAYLVRRAQEGYLDAYAELVDRYSGLAYRVALRVVGNHHDAEDVAQEALVAAWQQLPVEVKPVLPGTVPVLEWFAEERGHEGATHSPHD